MRLGVLDVGSNTVHLLVVDAHRGAHPTPMTSDKIELRLTEHLDATGALAAAGSDALVRAVERGGAAAAAAGCDDLIAFATSALCDATNSAAVLARVRVQTGVALEALREGVILRRLDTLDGTAQIDRSAQDAPERLGRLTTYEARCTG